MKFDPHIHHRRSIRLRNYDYAQAGAYYVTICVEKRECVFGDIANGEVELSEPGKIVLVRWLAIPDDFRHVELDEFVVMPNHIHGIFVLTHDAYGRGEAFAYTDANRDANATANASPFPEMPRGTKPRTFNAIVQNFKSVSTRKINDRRDTHGTKFWQRDGYEHVIRNDRDLERIRNYIRDNPSNWAEDEYNPQRR